MARPPAQKRPAPRPRTMQASEPPTTRRPASRVAPAEVAPLFPFARTAEDDELRDLSGYGWGV